jgi:protein-S-isoprenylcysteine O-methyltransferase Ste14
MYGGVLLIVLGEAAVFRSLNLLIYAPLLFVVFSLFVVGFEEPTLRRQFGESYERYRHTVPPWIPRVPRQRRNDASTD